MILPDVNALVYAHRTDAENHAAYRRWLDGVATSPSPFALADQVLTGFLRIVTHPRIYSPPTTIDAALEAVGDLLGMSNSVRLAPGSRHWEIFVGLCRKAGVSGNLISDAYLAALVIEHGCELITTDRDFARFPGLRWRHPLD